MAVSTCEGKFLARARKSDSRRCHVSTNVWKTCVFTTTRLYTPRRAAREHPDLRIPRDARPSDDERVSARLARDDSKSLERRAQGPTATSDECRSVARFSKTTTSSDVGGRTFASPSLARGHPRRCRSPRRAGDRRGLPRYPRQGRRRRAPGNPRGRVPSRAAGATLQKNLASPASRAISTNLGTSDEHVTIVTPIRPVSWLTDHLLDPSTRRSPAP